MTEFMSVHFLFPNRTPSEAHWALDYFASEILVCHAPVCRVKTILKLQPAKCVH